MHNDNVEEGPQYFQREGFKQVWHHLGTQHQNSKYKVGTLKLKKFLALAVVGVVALAACGGGSESSDTTERTRNAAISSPFANLAMFVSGDSDKGLTKIYQYVFNAAGVPTVTEVYSTVADGNTGIVGVAYDSYTNKLYWAMQESSAIKIKSVIPGTSAVETLYSIPGAYPYNFSFNRLYGQLVWNGQTTSPAVWAGDVNGSPIATVRSTASKSLSVADNSAIFNMSNTIYQWPLNGARPSVIETAASSPGWANALDTDNQLIYYSTDYSSGSNNLLRSASRIGDSPITLVTTSKIIRSIAVKSDGSIFWADGPRPSLGDAYSASTITWMNPSDPTSTQTFTPDPNLSITSMWIVETPESIMDPWIDGGLAVNTEHECSTGAWKDDNGGTRSSHYFQSGTETFQWYLNGELMSEGPVNTYTPTTTGKLKCVVTVNNLIGISSASSIEFDVIDPTATTTTSSTVEPSGSGSGSGDSATAPTTPSTPGVVAYKSIAVKWSYNSSKKVLTGTFKKVSGARTYSMTLTGATKKTVKCTTSGTKVTCKATLKKGSNSITVNAKNASKVIVAQRLASKRVR